jgi:hypothetical protein
LPGLARVWQDYGKWLVLAHFGSFFGSSMSHDGDKGKALFADFG